MKLLVSDYDNTIELHYNYTDNLGILKRNIIALNQFMENNILCIATGRHFDAINTTLRENKISFSYLCSNNGAELYDKNYSLLYCLPIDDYDLKKLSNLERIIIFRHPYNNDSIISSANIYIDEFEKFIEIKNYLNLNLKYSKIEYKFPKIKILNKQCDKVNIIDIIKKYENIKINDIYTIGDDINDMNMIYKYGGYTLKNGKKEVKKVAIKIYSELNELIYDMLKHDIKKLVINGEFESVI